VRWRSGARHMISSLGTSESAISSSRSFDSSLTQPPSRSWTLALPPTNCGHWLCLPANREPRSIDCQIHSGPWLQVFCHQTKPIWMSL
jgi:hypothetical protein